MPLTPGSRLGAYEIVAVLGAGGMGEVYKARDTRLDRTVAIKVLTAALAGDPELRLRFEQEARAIAALNHAHICTIHDVGRHDTVDFLVMEHLEGETLADRLKRAGPLPLADALAMAIQIGTALDAAHRLGIVHRDLKPGNVMLVRGAHGELSAKLLDFGLATAAATAPADDMSLLATIAPSAMVTKPPSVTASVGFSGTMQYMAPEQMNGEGDRRADVFAFGCVLYEMIAGRKAFAGAAPMVVVASIMSSEPPAIDALRDAPPVIDHLLRRCLEKDRDRRWQTMTDVTAELRWIAGQPLTTAAVPAPRARWSRTKVAAAAAAGIVLLFVVVPLALLGGVRALGSDPPVVAASSIQFEVTTPPTDRAALALSPDGRQLVFIAESNGRPMLWLRALDRAQNRLLPGTEDATNPFWSPDSRTIAFFADGKLKRIDADGTVPLAIADAPVPRGGTWGPNGVILFAPGVSSPIMRIGSGGGPVEAVTTPNSGSGPAHRQPQFLPDGRRFLFVSSLARPDTNGLYLASLDGTPPVRVLPEAATFAEPDQLLAVRQGTVVAYTFNGDGEISGEPVVLAEGGISDVSVQNGILAYRVGISQRRQLTWVDRRGTPLGTIGEPSTAGLGSPELSPDEREVALFYGPGGDNDVWVVDATRHIARRITEGPPADAHPVWDPDGEHVVFSGSRTDQGQTRMRTGGAATPEPLFAAGRHPGIILSWTRDRAFVLLGGAAEDANPNLRAVSIDGRRTIPVSETSYDEREGQFSPDGKWIAFVTNETGRNEVFAQSFPEGRGRMQISTGGGTQVRWSPDGREIYFIAPGGWMMGVALRPDATSLNPQSPVALFQTRLASGRNVIGNKPQYAVARDGRFLLNNALESVSTPIVVTTNWTRLLRR